MMSTSDQVAGAARLRTYLHVREGDPRPEHGAEDANQSEAAAEFHHLLPDQQLPVCSQVARQHQARVPQLASDS